MKVDLRPLRPARPAYPGLLVAGLSLYAVLSLISMATMSIGAGVLGFCLLGSFRERGRGPGRALARAAAEFRALFGEAPKRIRRFGWISLAFAVACVLSLVVARYHPLVIAGRSAHVNVLKDSAKIWYFAWPFVLWFALSACTLAERKKVLFWWFSAFGVLSVIGIQQHFTGWPRPQLIPPLNLRFNATLFLGHHLSVASILIFPFFALLDLPFTPFKREWLRWLCVVAAGVTLLFTYSRTLWIALPIGLVFWVFLRLGKRLGRRAKVAILVLSLLGGVIAYQVPMVHARLSAQMGIHEREDLWEANWRFFQERPITGVGLKLNQELSGYYLMEKYHTTDVFAGHAHDDVLDILGSMGLLGLAVFLAWWAALIALVVRAIRVGPSEGPFFGKGLLAAFVVFLLNGLTQVNFWEAKVQHQLMWMAAWALLWCGEGIRARSSD